LFRSHAIMPKIDNRVEAMKKLMHFHLSP
jgi:hypothetical protein